MIQKLTDEQANPKLVDKYGGQTTIALMIYHKNKGLADILKLGNDNEVPYIVIFYKGELIYREAGFKDKLSRLSRLLEFRIKNQ